MIIKSIFMVLFLFISVTLTCCSKEKISMQPLKPLIADGEWLKYKGSVNGGSDYYSIYVSRYETDPKWGNILKVYEYIHLADSNSTVPASYTNFPGFYIISLKLASLVQMTRDFRSTMTDYTKSLSGGKEMPAGLHQIYDQARKQVLYTVDFFNGNEIRARTYRYNVKQGYPFWDTSSIAFIGLRFLDINKPGIAYVDSPMILKDPVPGSAKIYSHETITTPAGTFRTIKIGFKIEDPFIGRLIDSYINGTYVWLSDDSSRRVIKLYDTLGEEMELTGISNVLK